MEAKYSQREPLQDNGKFGNAYWRWTILYASLIFLIATFPFWMSFLIPEIIITINCCVLLLFTLIWFAIGFNALNNFYRLEKAPLPPINALSASLERKFAHVVIVPCYLDPIEVLFDALGSLLMQPNASSLIVVVAFEAKTPDLPLKEKTVYEAFHRRFLHLLITIHTVKSQEEIPGGCSNKNYALREAYKYIQTHELQYFHQHAITVTTCDTDSLFHPNYFPTLEMVYNAKNPSLHQAPVNCVWQSPLFYNWDLDERPFFNRVTCLMRSMMMLGGLISFNLNPMSIFSYPIELGLQVGFINPRYGVDDIIAKVRWMCFTNEQVPIELLPIPSISGPTIGLSIFQEYEEWSRQIRRWIIGSSESFHYFLIHFQGKPLIWGIQWFFFFFSYYAVLLCCAGIYSIFATIPYPWIMNYDWQFIGNYSIMNVLGMLFLAGQYLVFAIAFWIDYRAKQLMTIEEKKLSWWRNLLHWLMAPIVLLVYSMIAFASIISFVWKGKKMARHDMAAKEGLEKSNPNYKNINQLIITDIPIMETTDYSFRSEVSSITREDRTDSTPHPHQRPLLADYQQETEEEAQTDRRRRQQSDSLYGEESSREKRRSTSTSKDSRNSFLMQYSKEGLPQRNVMIPPQTSNTMGEEIEETLPDTTGVLCHLPKYFYFGKYRYEVPPLV